MTEENCLAQSCENGVNKFSKGEKRNMFSGLTQKIERGLSMLHEATRRTAGKENGFDTFFLFHPTGPLLFSLALTTPCSKTVTSSRC